MNNEQMLDKIHSYGKDIAVIKSRQDEYEKIANSIHELAKNVAAMTTEVKILAKNTDKSITELKNAISEVRKDVKEGQQRHGERIGDMEVDIRQIKQNEKDIADMSDKLDALRMEPGEKWKTVAIEVVRWLVVGGLGALLIGHLVGA